MTNDVDSVVCDYQWPAVGLFVVEVYIVQSDVTGMTDVKTFGRDGAEHPGFGIDFLLFRWCALAVSFGLTARE